MNIGENVVFYMRLNECAPPREVMIRWSTTPYNYTVTYWGQVGLISGDAGGVNIRPLPAAGSWARVEIPLSQLHLETYTLIQMDINYRDGQAWFDHIGKSGNHPPAAITSFTADHTSPQNAGTAITWTATAATSIPPAQYRFERQDGGVWSVVQPYGSGSTYMWTPVAGDAGDHSVRVSARNSGSIADFEDTRTLPITITTGSWALVALRREREFGQGQVWCRLRGCCAESEPIADWTSTEGFASEIGAGNCRCA